MKVLTWVERERNLEDIVPPKAVTLDYLVGATLECPRCAGLAIYERAYGWCGALIEVAIVARCVICGWTDDARFRRDFVAREQQRRAVREAGPHRGATTVRWGATPTEPGEGTVPQDGHAHPYW